VRTGRVWARLLGLGAAVVEEVNFGDQGDVVVAARPRWRERDRCGVCRRRSPGLDLGEGRRRWRALDLGTMLAYVEADAPRVRCRDHGVVVCRPVGASRVALHALLRGPGGVAGGATLQEGRRRAAGIAWRTVGAICERVAAEAGGQRDLLAGLHWIGIDEISRRKGQRYLTVVVDHHTGRLMWASAGRDRRTVEAFLDALGPERCQQIELVSADMATWIAGPIAERCPDAVRCVDPFQVVQLATEPDRVPS
jgi:transposase